jgi:hypothetical protein
MFHVKHGLFRAAGAVTCRGGSPACSPRVAHRSASLFHVKHPRGDVTASDIAPGPRQPGRMRAATPSESLAMPSAGRDMSQVHGRAHDPAT